MTAIKEKMKAEMAFYEELEKALHNAWLQGLPLGDIPILRSRLLETASKYFAERR